MSDFDWSTVKAWANYTPADWARIGAVIDARIGDVSKTPFGQNSAFKGFTDAELRLELISHISGIAAGFNMLNLVGDRGEATVAQEAKALRAVAAAAKKLDAALADLGRVRHSFKESLLDIDQRSEEFIYQLGHKADDHASYLEGRVRRGRPGNIKRNVFWDGLRRFWIEQLNGNRGRARNVEQDIDSGLVDFIHVCSRPVMDHLDCGIDKVDEWLRPPRKRRAKSKTAA